MMEVARSFNTLYIWLDLVLEIDRLPEAGESWLGSRYSYVPGGKGANQAVAASRDGRRVPGYAVPAVDTTAAGALAVTRVGAQPSMPRRAEVEP